MNKQARSKPNIDFFMYKEKQEKKKKINVTQKKDFYKLKVENQASKS